MLKARDWRQRRTRDHALVFGPALLLAVAAFVVAVNFVKPAPPRRIGLATGRPGRLNVDAEARALLC